MSDYPNVRDCEHGKLRRSCDICEYEQEIKELTEDNQRLKDWLYRIQRTAALNDAGYHVNLGNYIAKIAAERRKYADAQ